MPRGPQWKRDNAELERQRGERAVSGENVEIVRRVMHSFAEGDLEAALADIDPQATLDWSNSNAPDSGVYTGHAAWLTFMRARHDVLGERRFDPVELLAPADDTVVLIGRVLERGRASGIEVESRGAAVWTLGEGRVVRLKIYQSSDDALKAVGLASSREVARFMPEGRG